MFAGIFNMLKEPFTSNSASVNTSTLTTYFGTTLPNVIYSNDPKLNIGNLTKTNDVNLNLKNAYIQPVLSGNSLATSQSLCESVGTGDQFDHLTNLANTQDQNTRLRCGWMYNNQNPANGRGAYGVREGPFNTAASGTWMWDLNAAKQKYHKSICQNVQGCSDIDSSIYKNRCGWSTTAGKGIPVINGQVAYPYDPNATCSSDSLVTSARSCPPPPPPNSLVSSDPSSKVPPANTCDPLPSGNLRRDCILQKVLGAGCSDKGTLAQALNAGSDSNYFNVLSQSPAYQLYQQRAVIGLDETSLKTGKVTVSQALDEFKRVNDQASSALNGGLQYAARDLCNKNGAFEKFDFCSELQDSSPGPFDMKCIQTVFLEAGGQQSGAAFPSNSTSRTWNSMGKWLDVKNATQTMLANTKSSDRTTQEKAMKDFYGITLENKRKPIFTPAQGVEIFWFSSNSYDITVPTIFLGRRIRRTIPFINQSIDLVANAGQGNQNLSMMYFTNIVGLVDNTSALMRVTSDDGFATTFNKPLSNIYNNKIVNSASELTATVYQPPATYTQNSPFIIKQYEPNMLSGYYFQGNGGLYYQLQINLTSRPGVWFPLDGSNLSLTQEAYAPMLSFETNPDFKRYGCDFPFCDKRLGGLRMKWNNQPGYGSNFSYATSAKDPVNFPLNKSSLNMGPGRIQSAFKIKLYSCMTMTILVKINNSMASGLFGLFSPSNNILLKTIPVSPTEVYLGVDTNAGNVASGLTITVGVPTLIVIRMLRDDENDIYSLSSLQFGVGKLSYIQSNPSALKQSSPIKYSNPSQLENPDTTNAYTLYFGQYASCNIYWLRMFDYNLTGDNLKRDANNNWLGYDM
jgi:hypothetical protein